MLKRVIPILTLKNKELVKSIQFNNHKYIGDIINAVKIYNELEVDELLIFDISASINSTGIDYKYLQNITSECFVPMTYGGNIDTFEKIENLIKIGIEKVCINTASQDKEFIADAVKIFGTSTICVCVDYKYMSGIPIVFFKNGTVKADINAVQHILDLNHLQVGEIIIQNIDRDGKYIGYDIDLLKTIKNKVNNPIIIAGGCKDKFDIKDALKSGANACAAGSLFVYYTSAKGILINYLDQDDFNEIGIER